MTELSTTGGDEQTLRRDSSGVETEALRVLVVDDEDALRGTLARVLRQRGMDAAVAENGYAALDLLDRESFDVVLVDVRMPGLTGTQFLERVKAAGYPVEVIMMTAFADINTTVAAVKGGAYGFLTKPFVSNEAVVIEVQNAAQFKQLREKNQSLERRLSARGPAGDMVGSCSAMREVYRLVEGVATTNSTILILGESGTGKELVARAVHERSRRAGKALVTVNCAAIPHELVESELFGHTRGAFTSAVSARAGLFEAANGGTLFLDEIGDLPTSAQVKLLRVLQSGEVKQVGSDSVKHVDVRVIAATNVDLKAAIAAGTFRQDLYYRLNVIAIPLPSLKERGDDILLLAHHFIQKHAPLAGRKAVRLAHEAALAIQRYDWPGNVRELEHAVERAVVLSEGDTIPVSAFPIEVQRAAVSRVPAPPSSSPSISTFGDPPTSGAGASAAPRSMDALIEMLELGAMTYADAKKRVLADFNDAYVGALLRSANGNMSEAARRSGLDRSNFRRLVRTTSVDAGPGSAKASVRGGDE